MAAMTVAQAIKHVSQYPNPVDDDIVNQKVYEIIPRVLFQIANTPDQKVRGSLARSTKARKMILNRLVGRRRPGSRPLGTTGTAVTFDDMTQGLLDV